MLCSSCCPASSRSGSSVLSECVRMLELPTWIDSSSTAGSRVSRKFGKISKRFFPSTDCSECRLARAIQSFQPTMQPCPSSTTMPTSSASKTDPNSSSDTSSNMASSLPSDAVDKVAHNVVQCGYRGQAHEQGDKAANITILDREVDVKEQHQSIAAPLANIEQRIAVSSNDRGKRHPHRSTQHVRDRGQARVEDNISRLRQRLLLQIDHIFQGMLLSHDRPDQFQALSFRKDQKGPTRERSFERLLHSNQLRRMTFFNHTRGDTSAHDIDRRDRQQHLLADHPAQAGGGTADAHVRYFRKRILFDLGELACVDLHCAAFLRRRTAPDKNAPRASSVRGLVTKAALSSLARPIISSCTFADTTARGILG